VEKLQFIERIVSVGREGSVEEFKSTDGVKFVEELEARLRTMEDVAELGGILGDVVNRLVFRNEALDVVAELAVVSGLVVAKELIAGGVDVVVGPTAGGEANVSVELGRFNEPRVGLLDVLVPEPLNVLVVERLKVGVGGVSEPIAEDGGGLGGEDTGSVGV